MELVYITLHAMIDFCMVLHSWDGTDIDDIAISNETPSQQVVFVKAAHVEKEHRYIYIYVLKTFIQETTLMYMSLYIIVYIIYLYLKNNRFLWYYSYFLNG